MQTGCLTQSKGLIEGTLPEAWRNSLINKALERLKALVVHW